jgi:positive regulator of sigma E activity
MSIHFGLVRQIKENGLAEVQTDRRNACGGCQSSDGCRACLSGGGKLLRNIPAADNRILTIIVTQTEGI